MLWILLLTSCTPPDVISRGETALVIDSGETDTTDTQEPDDTAETIDEHGVWEDPAMCRIEISCDEEIPDEPKIPCDLRIVEAEGEILYEGTAGVELRGRSSLYFPKPQYAVELWEGSREVLPVASDWRYLDTGVDPGEGWADPGFDDSTWPLAPAPLGYGEDSLNTEISYGGDSSNKQPTAWFRGRFTSPELAEDETLRLSLRRDDGAIVYLNGEELLRTNMPEGEVSAGSWAAGTCSDDGRSWQPVEIDLALLVEGENTLAVGVHQASPTSSDTIFDLRIDALGAEAPVDLFDMGKESDWVLNGAYIDRALMRNKLCFDTFQSFGEENYAPQSVYCELMLNSEQKGVYFLSERIKRDDDRLDLSDSMSGDTFIIKNNDSGDGFLESASAYGEWHLVYPKADEISEEALAEIRASVSAWEQAVLAGTEEMFDHVDLDSAVDFVIIEELSRNNDAYFLSLHLWKDAGGKLHFVPWDLDLTFGYPVDSCGPEDWIASRLNIVAKMAEQPIFQERLAERWAELRQDQLSEEVLFARMDSYEAIMGETAYENFEIWPFEEITFEWGGQDWLCPVSSYDEERERIRAWLHDRLLWVDANINEY